MSGERAGGEHSYAGTVRDLGNLSVGAGQCGISTSGLGGLKLTGLEAGG